MINVDYTLIVQIANFLVLLFILNLILYRPVRAMLRRRQEEMGSYAGMIEDYLEKSTRYQRELEEDMAGARREGHKTKEGLKGEGLDREKSMLQEASSEAGQRLDRAKQEIEKSIQAVRKSLEDEVGQFSRELAEKVLGRSVG